MGIQCEKDEAGEQQVLLVDILMYGLWAVVVVGVVVSVGYRVWLRIRRRR